MPAGDTSPPPVSNIPAYDDAYMEFFRDSVYGIMGEDKLLGGIDVVHDRRDGPIRNVRTEQPLDQPMLSTSFSFTIGIDAIRTMDVGALAVAINNTAREFIEGQSRAFFGHLNKICWHCNAKCRRRSADD